MCLLGFAKSLKAAFQAGELLLFFFNACSYAAQQERQMQETVSY